MLGIDFYILQTQIERSGLEEAALLDERLNGLEMTVCKVHREIAAVSASIQSTHQRLFAAEWRIDKVCNICNVMSIASLCKC